MNKFVGNGTQVATIPATQVMKFAFEQHPRRLNMAIQHTASNYDDVSKELDQATDRLHESISRLIATENETATRAKAALSRAKDNAAQITDALNRVNRILGADFSQKLEQLERVAAAMEQLAALDKAGKLRNVISALEG